MKKSPYKITMFIITMISLVLLIVICVHLEIINIDYTDEIWNKVKDFFANDYVVNIISTIITAVCLYYFQIWYSKRKIRNDFRCNEAILDIFDGIEQSIELKSHFEFAKEKAEKSTCKLDYMNPNLSESEKNEIASKKMDLESEIYIEFFIENQNNINLCQDILIYKNNDILIDSIQIAFFINLNFKLLNIINNIKNRKPNIEGKFELICDDYKKYTDNKSDKNLQYSLGFRIRTYITDLMFLSNYYNDLLEYLGYDPIVNKINLEVFNSLCPSNQKVSDYLRLPIEEKIKLQKKINKIKRMKIIKYRILKFFQKEK